MLYKDLQKNLFVRARRAVRGGRRSDFVKTSKRLQRFMPPVGGVFVVFEASQSRANPPILYSLFILSSKWPEIRRKIFFVFFAGIFDIGTYPSIG